jgi:long-chain fatty acid transport protein
MRPRRRLRTSIFAAVVFLAVLAGAAGARAQPLTIPRFDFSFSNPGARSVGFGGAFAALADDATAAYANPAGLVQLAEPEVSLEARRWNRSPSFLSGGRIEGEPTGIGLDTHEAGLLFGHDHSQEIGPSFASVVIPKGRWSFALYGHQLAKFEESAESQGFFLPTRFPGSRESVDLEVSTVGLAAGWRMNDRFSFGLGIVYSDASLATRSAAFLPDDDSEQSQFGPISFLPERRISTSTLAIDGTDVTVNAGVLGRLSEQISAGFFFRQGAEVQGISDFEAGPAIPFESSIRNRAVFKVPNVVGGGVAWRSSGGHMTFAGEVDRVGYSGLVRVLDSEDVEVENREYSNAWEYHLGAEYALLQHKPILALRAGAWVEANGDDLEHENFTHLAAGLGIAAKTFQIDLAGDFSDERDTASLSFIYTF